MSVGVASRNDALVPVHEMSTERLRREYVSLKSTTYSLTVEESHLMRKIETLREESVRAELTAEMKEEQVSNQLFRRLDGAEKEVQRYQGLLKEEENEAESLSKRIKEMRSQQTEVENVLEERQEYLLMNLQRKLLDMANKKTLVEQELMMERQRYLDVLVTRLNGLRGRGSMSSADSSVTNHPQLHPSDAGATHAERHVDAALAPPATPPSASPTPPPAASSCPATCDTGSAKQAERGCREDAAAAGAAPQLTFAPSTSFTGVRRTKDALGGSTLHGSFNSASARFSNSTTPRSSEVTPRSSHSSETHHAVVALERKLNQLLLEQAAAMQRTSATEKQCAELTAKLRAVQEATFLDRARTSKMREELKEARSRLSEAETSGAATVSSSFDDSSVMSGKNLSFDQYGSLTVSNLSLRERTRELLSSVPPPNLN
ncbi:hypothetical protein NESM_000131800 [Novymonas esmeraldas]|uniref:Coiled-coil domain-containing protein 6 n=1 Tax=Novymonas esmeraldas TaxID=1808958 RepID=A0AAW0F332_9TRYP